MPPKPLTRHSACLRCHRMKLRCPPPEDTTSSCGRCFRLKVNCANPPPKEGGKTAASHSTAPFGGMRQGLHASHNAEPHEPSCPDAAKNHFPGQSGASAIPACLSFPSPPSSTFGMSEYFTPFSESEHPTSITADFEFCDFIYSGDLASGGQNATGVFNGFGPFLVPESRQFGHSESMLSVGSSLVESDDDLTGLRLRLSQRYHRFRSASARGSLSGSSEEGSDLFSPINCVWFGDALKDISEFLSIIKTYGRETSPAARNSRKGSSWTSISTVVTLDIILAYLQTVAVFDDLCIHLCRNLRTSSQGSLPDLQIFPGLQLAGLCDEQGHLQTKILLQAVMHHFEAIERVLGLPVAYRVSGRLDNYTSLIKNHRQYSSLMAMIMEDEGGKTTLASLKRSLKEMAECIYRLPTV
ncbi:hypothetical protein CSUB01_12440 [Colletotrichum sublineola]|uniref:Zn(2)-C6 fungal-type domain-containing protein n=1 Tax=Colletotrichum sublineola TaxID=1173701 RepID=A0A066XR65_COLSU|nr:hypothetical protein CSUB01_12440 [Colletotrichum sublineola]